MSEQCNVRIMQQAIVDFVDGGSRAEAKEFNGLNARNGLQVTARKKKKWESLSYNLRELNSANNINNQEMKSLLNLLEERTDEPTS